MKAGLHGWNLFWYSAGLAVGGTVAAGRTVIHRFAPPPAGTPDTGPARSDTGSARPDTARVRTRSAPARAARPPSAPSGRAAPHLAVRKPSRPARRARA